MMDMHREGVVILLENTHGQIAFQLRDDNPDILYPNYWGLFGGWMEVGESPQQAAVREVREELGYLVNPSSLVYLTVYIDGEVTSHLFHYSVADDLQDVTLMEGRAIRFMTLADIEKQRVIPRHQAMLKWYRHTEARSRNHNFQH